MQIITTHLTRMKPGYVCVAGIEPASEKHVRPVLDRRRLSRALLRKDGGVFGIGALVDLGPTRAAGHPPETEDHEFSVENLTYRHRLKPDAFWKCLNQTSHSKLKRIFGDQLEQRESSCTVDINSGIASLGHLRPKQVSYFGLNPWGKIRMHVSDGEFHSDLSVTDVRLYKSDQLTVRSRILKSVSDRLSKTPVILAVGLTRAWARGNDDTERHWLQVNNIHFEDDALGEIFEF
jgi:hypothetical protein